MEDNLNNIFSKNLARLMKKMKIDNATLAEITGIALNTISGYRSGRIQPTAPKIILIARALNVRTDTLLT